MCENGTKGVSSQQHEIAQILEEREQRRAQSVEESNHHSLVICDQLSGPSSDQVFSDVPQAARAHFHFDHGVRNFSGPAAGTQLIAHVKFDFQLY